MNVLNHVANGSFRMLLKHLLYICIHSYMFWLSTLSDIVSPKPVWIIKRKILHRNSEIYLRNIFPRVGFQLNKLQQQQKYQYAHVLTIFAIFFSLESLGNYQVSLIWQKLRLFNRYFKLFVLDLHN